MNKVNIYTYYLSFIQMLNVNIIHLFYVFIDIIKTLENSK